MSAIEVLNEFNDILWYIPLVLIVCLGIYSTIRLKGIQLRELKEMCKVTFSKESNKSGRISSFQVFCMSMGNRIGVGNISGPILAILVGGPGAIFWMWVFAAIGMATSFLETTIGQLFKSRESDGEYHGGPAFNIMKGLGMKKFGLFVAFVMVLMYILGYVSMEVCSMSEALCGAFVFEHNSLVFALILTAITVLIVIGGLKGVAKMSATLVPIMAILWLVVCIVSDILSHEGIISAFGSIFANAFSVPSAVGGGIGAMLIIGMKRGVLSNEAGVGTITNISSMADVKHPARQGLSQSLGVLIDTVVSTLTALVILSFGNIDTIIGTGLESVPLLQYVLGTTIGGIAPYAVALFMFIFALTCLMADFVIGENNLMLITDSKTAKIGMRVALLAIVFLSSFMASDGLFVFVDIMLAICGMINTIVMFRLGKLAVEAYNDYRAQKKAGIEEPVFHKISMSDSTGVTEWAD